MKRFIVFIVIVLFVNASFGQRRLTEDFLQHIGDSVVVTGKIYGGAFLANIKTKPTFLNLGDTSPARRLIIRIEPEDRDKFPAPPEEYFKDKEVTVTGVLQDYRGTPLIRIYGPAMLTTASSIPDPILSSIKLPAEPQDLKVVVPDTLVKAKWIRTVAEKSVAESKRKVAKARKSIFLRTAPYKNGAVVAELQRGTPVSVLYTSRRWSYVSLGSADSFNTVTGYVKHRKIRHLANPAVSADIAKL